MKHSLKKGPSLAECVAGHDLYALEVRRTCSINTRECTGVFCASSASFALLKIRCCGTQYVSRTSSVS